MNYTPEEIRRINRLIATKIEGWKQSEQVELLNHKDEKYIGRLWLNGDGDEMGIVNEYSPNYCFPQYHTSPADLLRAWDAIPENLEKKNLDYEGSTHAIIGEDHPQKGGGTYWKTAGESPSFHGPDRTTKALYSGIAEYVLGMEGGGECQ